MPEKTKNGKQYKVSGKTFTWHPDPDEGEELPDVVLPLRMKLKLIREHLDRPLDVGAMNDVLVAVAPQHEDTYGEMDLNDLQAMYVAWQEEYEKLSGATLGE